MAEKRLIISPQAGLGNRLRAINSALILAEKSQRQLLHCWLPARPSHSQGHVNILQQCAFEEFFAPSSFISPAAKSIHVDEVYSEWGPADYWFSQQSTGQQYFDAFATHKTINTAAAISRSSADTLLLETTRRVWPDDQDGISIMLPQGDALMEAINAYKKLDPKPEYKQHLKKMPMASIGIAIRGGDLLKYCPEARQDMGHIRAWIDAMVSRDGDIAVFADNNSIFDALKLPAATAAFNKELHKYLENLLPAQKAFVSFLYLATRCSFIYGTPGSSFAQEASLFGNKTYGRILDSRPHSFRRMETTSI